MGKPTGLAKEQRRALGELRDLPALAAFYLAGGTALTFHLGHRLSHDLDLFSRGVDVDLDAIRVSVQRLSPATRVISQSEVLLRLEFRGASVDAVRYQYAPLESPAAGPEGFPVASLRDLAAMKLSTIAGRSLRRDFWDLYTICQSRLSLADAGAAYLARFGLARPDLYHVARALTYFADAERDPVLPAGLTAKHWETIKSYFTREGPSLLREPPLG